MINLVPKPIRHLFAESQPLRKEVKAFSKKGRPGDLTNAIFTVFAAPINTTLNMWAKDVAQKKAEAVIRIALAATGAGILCYSGGAVATSAVAASLISLPAVAIASGTCLMAQGITAVVSSLSTGILTELGIGLVTFASGWLALELHNVVPFGIMEMSSVGLTDKLANFIMPQ